MEGVVVQTACRGVGFRQPAPMPRGEPGSLALALADTQGATAHVLLGNGRMSAALAVFLLCLVFFHSLIPP